MSQRMVWAVNPFGDEKGYFKKSLKAVERFATITGHEVEPVFVMAPAKMFLPAGAEVALLDPPQPEADKAWERLTKGVKMKALMKPTILREDALSQRGMAKALVAHGDRVGADLIAVATHGRKGLARAFLGSFAETLLHQSHLPVFVFQPGVEARPKIKRILVLVDVPLENKAPLDRVLEMAKGAGASVTLFHKIDYVTEYTNTFLHQVPRYEGYLEHDEEVRRKELDALVAHGKSRGVKVGYVLDTKPGYVGDRALALAKKEKADLIAVLPKTGPVEAALLGSVTRQVIRGAKCPVWVMRG